MTPSETLNAAADLIRDLAAKASPGPWESAREFSQPNVVYAKGRLVDSVGVAGRRLDLNDRIFTGQTASRSRSEYEADARWIAALSPALAPLLINWLETEAACIASVDDVKRIMPKILDGIESGAGGEDTTVTVTIDTSGAALAFAQAILGSGVDTP